jgi:hypothetical protein
MEDWAKIYIRYLGAFRRLEEVHVNMVQPQRRKVCRRALEACMGRMLVVQRWMVGPLVCMCVGVQLKAACV